MKTILPVVLLMFAFVTSSYAQQYDKYVIQFTDKNNSPYSLTNPSQYLSEKAIARRTKYDIAIDSTDLPVNPAYIQTVLAQGNVTLLAKSRWLNDILILTTDQAALDAINNLPFVKKEQVQGFLIAHNNGSALDKFIAESNFTQAPAGTNGITGDTLNYSSTYDQIHIHLGEFLHNKGYQGQGMTIAVLDAGFFHYRTLKAFDSMRLNNHVLGEKDFVDFDNSVNEDNAHGMECLSTIAANMPGVMVGTAPQAKFWLLRSENANSEYPVEEHNWVVAAEYADSAGADMISSSLGYNLFDDGSFNHSYTDFYKNSTTVTKGAAYAAKKGMIVTNSAGNEGNNSWQYLVFPADADSVCTVGAIDVNGNAASFTSLGYPGKVKPNIVSVGVGTTVYGTNDQPVSGNGTSFSNPNINGLIACLWQAFPQYNNMTILDAVYRSANRYANPDNRHGYGIPNMKTAYRILKQKQNDSIYGSEWMFATPNPFTDSIHVKFIGQVDGPVTLTLYDENAVVAATINLVTEQYEVYDMVFKSLANLPGGDYKVTYSDGTTSRSITLSKTGTTLPDWLLATPVPFTTKLTVYLKAPETGQATIRVIDAGGKLLQSQQLAVTQNTVYRIYFNNVGALAKAIYFIQYQGPKQKKTIKAFKG